MEKTAYNVPNELNPYKMHLFCFFFTGILFIKFSGISHNRGQDVIKKNKKS